MRESSSRRRRRTRREPATTLRAAKRTPGPRHTRLVRPLTPTSEQTMNAYCTTRLLVATALLFLPAFASAQECVGLPSGARGILTYGFEGTDGATGQGLGFAYQTQRGAMILQHRWLGDFTLVDEMRTTDLQVSARAPSVALPVCFTAGLQWTSYDNDRREGESWRADNPGYRTRMIREGGLYQRARIPAGIAIGHEFRLTESVAITPYLAPGLVYERERYDPEPGSRQIRHTIGWRADGGVTASIGWLVLRSTLRETRTRDYALSSQHNFLELTVQAGVRFQ